MSRGACLGLAAALAASAVGGTVSCQSVGRSIQARPAAPPLTAMVLPPSLLTPRSQRYSLAVREFVDQTGKAAGPATSAGEVLVTALDSGARFDLYDIREAVPAAAPARAQATAPPQRPEPASEPAAPVEAADEYRIFQGIVDGVLESYVTAVSTKRMEIDYRVVDPYTSRVVSSGSARLGLRGGGLVREDVTKLARDVSRPFVKPKILAEYELKVRDVTLDREDVKLTLTGGSDQQIRRGFVGFVYEEDPDAGVERYLAKFVIVNVFPEAAVGIVVDHCNAIDRCAPGEQVAAVEQAKSVQVGSRVRFK